MNRDAYTSFAEKVKTQMQTLDYEEQLGIFNDCCFRNESEKKA